MVEVSWFTERFFHETSFHTLKVGIYFFIKIQPYISFKKMSMIVQAAATLVDTDFSTSRKNCELLPKYCLDQQNSRTKVVDLQKMQLMVFWEKFRAHTWSFMHFQTWWSKTHHTTELRTAVVSLPTQKRLIFVENQWYTKKKACSFHFDLNATKIPCDEQGLRHLFPSAQVQLRHNSGQLNEFFLLQENF